MSYYLHSKPVFDSLDLLPGNSRVPIAGPSQADGGDDDTLDAALRSVPLPEGLMTRLVKWAYSASDETADHADWLGC